MKEILFTALLSGIIVTSGCSFSSNKEAQPEEIKTANKVTKMVEVKEQTIGIQVCDDYLDVLLCIANASEDNKKNQYITTYNDMTAARKNTSVDQLTSLCTGLTKNLEENPTILKETGCKL